MGGPIQPMTNSNSSSLNSKVLASRMRPVILFIYLFIYYLVFAVTVVLIGGGVSVWVPG